MGVTEKIENIRSACRDTPNKQRLADAAGRTRDWVNKFQSGKVESPAGDVLDRICRYLDLDFETGLPLEEPRQKVIEVPGLSGPLELDDETAEAEAIALLGEVCAGNGSFAAETVEMHVGNGGLMEPRTVSIGESIYATSRRSRQNQVLCVMVSGHSMEPECRDGDYLVVERTENLGLVRDKDLVIVDLDGTGNYTLKQYRKGSAGNPNEPALLMPINQDAGFSTVICNKHQRLWGIVIGQYRSRG